MQYQTLLQPMKIQCQQDDILNIAQAEFCQYSKVFPSYDRLLSCKTSSPSGVWKTSIGVLGPWEVWKLSHYTN